MSAGIKSTKVTFSSRDIPISGILYEPVSESKVASTKAAVVVSHPGGGVKEQTASFHAKFLAENGFVALVFDAAYQGESGGEPRGIEDPSQRIEDVKAAVTYLSILEDKVDPSRIGAVGICASGMYVPIAASTDKRIKSVATVSAADFGSVIREGIRNADGKPMQTTEQLSSALEGAAASRTKFVKGESYDLFNLFPQREQLSDATPLLFKEAYDYYCTPRGSHPRSTGIFQPWSMELLAGFYGATDVLKQMAPRPLLYIAGEKADTLYFSKEAYAVASEPKELYIVEGKTHVDLYDSKHHFPKLLDFFVTTLTR